MVATAAIYLIILVQFKSEVPVTPKKLRNVQNT